MLRLCMGFSLLRPGGRRAPWKGARPSAFSGSPSSLPLQRLYCGPQAGRFSFACAPRAPFRPFSPARFARARRRQLFAFCGPAAGRCLWPCVYKAGAAPAGRPLLYMRTVPGATAKCSPVHGRLPAPAARIQRTAKRRTCSLGRWHRKPHARHASYRGHGKRQRHQQNKAAQKRKHLCGQRVLYRREIGAEHDVGAHEHGP